MIRRPSWLASAVTALILAAAPRGAWGAPPVEDATTDVPEAEDPADASKDATDFSVGAGIIGSTGNARNVSGNANIDTRVRRGAHQFTGKFLYNGALSSPDPDEILVPNLSRQLARARYDYFLPLRFVVFTQGQWRRDLFQGLRTRLNFDLGAGYYAIDSEKHRVWFQAGYNLQWDLRTLWLTYETNDDGNILLDDAGQPNPILPETVLAHQARLFAGTENHFGNAAEFRLSVEYLQDVVNTENLYVNLESSLSAHIAAGFSLGLSFLLQYENDPLPGIKPLDTVTAFNVLYKLDGASIAEGKKRRKARRAKKAAAASTGASASED